MSKIPAIELEEFSDTTTLVNVDFDTYGEIYVWDGEAIFDIKTICLTVADLEAIIFRMKEMEREE